MTTDGYRPDIDGLRAIAVIAVVLFHAFPALLPGGFIGVDVFFVISGYLITGIILDGLTANRFTFTSFYARRIRRIFPALALVLIACYAAGWFTLFAAAFKALNRHIAAGVAFVSNLALWQEAGYFDGAADTKPLQHLWSLGIEEQFYLVWPLALVIAWRVGVPAVWLTVVLGAMSFALNLDHIRRDLVGTFYSPLTRVWELLAGAMLSAAASDRSAPGRWWQALRTVPARVADLTAAFGVALIVAAAVWLDGTRLFPGAWALMPVLGTMLLIVTQPSALNRRVLSHRLLVAVGLISYPLYLWHWPLLSFARLMFSATPPVAVRAGLVAASVGLAAVTYIWLERPVRFGPRRRLAVSGLVAIMVAALAVSWSTYVRDGLPQRAITRTDRAEFLEYYQYLHRHGLADAYRRECDFMDWPTERLRDAIDPSCTEAGAAATILLWGDSFAQALSAGLRAVVPAGVRVAQVATSACRPLLTTDPLALGGRCYRANTAALAQVRALHPAIVVMAQQSDHLLTDWTDMTRRLRESGAGGVVLVGPSPGWVPSLPDVVVRHYWGRSYERVSEGLAPRMFEDDRELKRRTAGLDGLTYVSLIDGLCAADGCQAVATTSRSRDLLAFDFGHLTPAGSIYVGETVLRPYFNPPLWR